MVTNDKETLAKKVYLELPLSLEQQKLYKELNKTMSHHDIFMWGRKLELGLLSERNKECTKMKR